MADNWERVSTGGVWEERYAYSRAVRAGGWVFLTGTAPVAPDGSTHASGDLHAQTLRCYEIIEGALQRLGLDRRAIVRSRVFLTDISRIDEMGRAHREFFGDHRPCLTGVGISALVRPDMLVEIECEALDQNV